MQVLFETTERVNGIDFLVAVYEDGGLLLDCKRRRTSFMVIYSPSQSTVSVRTRKEWQLWEGVARVWDLFTIISDESFESRYTPAQRDLMWDVAHI